MSDVRDGAETKNAQVEGSAELSPTGALGGVSRRGLLKGAAFVAAAGTTLAITPRSARAQGPGGAVPGTVLADTPSNRASDARLLRFDAANSNFAQFPLSVQPINDDEARFDDFRGNFSKTLRHNALGEVGRGSYRSLLAALDSRDPADFEAILVGRPNDPQRNRLVSPQAAYAFELSGADGNASRIPAAPAVDGAETEAEMGELYWYSATRDVPFAEYETRNIIQRAADDLNRFARSDIFPQDPSGGGVTPATLFRGSIPVVGTAAGVLGGPFVSQFLFQPFALGQLSVEQRYARVEPGARNQFMTTFSDFLRILRGFDPNAADADGNATLFTGQTRFIASMRDLSEYVHRDLPLQAPLFAFLIAAGLGDDALDPSVPYLRSNSNTQQGFVSFGVADMTQLVTLSTRQALTGAWFQKWACHRRLRPEQYAGRINVQLRGQQDYGLGGQDLLGSEALQRAIREVRRTNGTPTDPANDGLLPMGYPEGCPAHPAYPGGHSSFAAAGATVVKAFVNEDFVFPNPVVANRGGTALDPFTGPALTLGGELNKLVSNITHARDAAGMHWRSDGVGNLIGEAAAIATLADYSRTFNEDTDGLTLTRFDGQRIRIRNGQVHEI